VCCDDGTYCPFGLKCVSKTDCCPATGCATAVSSKPVSLTTSVAGDVSSSPVSDRSSYDYVSAISKYISIFTELSQFIVTSTASNGSTAVATEQVPYTTTVTVYANTTANASAQFSATASILAATQTLTTSTGRINASSISSGAAKVGRYWSGATGGVTVMTIVIASAIFTLQ
jgi:hypothetical protein